jgi:hypothetical protein
MYAVEIDLVEEHDLILLHGMEETGSLTSEVSRWFATNLSSIDCLVNLPIWPSEQNALSMFPIRRGWLSAVRLFIRFGSTAPSPEAPLEPACRV